MNRPSSIFLYVHLVKTFTHYIMALSLDTILPVGMLLNATVATVFLVLTIVFLIMSRKSTANAWDKDAAQMFAFLFGVLSISTALAVRR